MTYVWKSLVRDLVQAFAMPCANYPEADRCDCEAHNKSMKAFLKAKDALGDG